MNRQRLEFALERLQPHDWKKFEEFASEFLLSEFNNLKTVASSSGDRGTALSGNGGRGLHAA
jgi:hypothetical protein